MAKLLDDQAKKIVENFQSGKRDATIIIFIPQKDKSGRILADQDQWANAAHDLFARLFGGATGFTNLSGSWLNKERNEIHFEAPIMIQTLTKRENVTEASVSEVLTFARRLGAKTKQACVGVVVSDVFYEIYDFEDV